VDVSGVPDLHVEPVVLAEVLPLREEYRRLMACQIVHDSWHARGFTELYVVRVWDAVAGYGAVGGVQGTPRDTVKEFYLRPAFQDLAVPLCRALIARSDARSIEAQSNDALLTTLLEALTRDHTSDTLLFAAGEPSTLHVPDVHLRSIDPAEHAQVFRHTTEPIGTWGLERAGSLVATGGFLLHYNRPFADIYMEVARSAQRRGYGSYLVQELVRLTREAGHVPAARCHRDNVGSQRALERGGLRACGRIVRGTLSDSRE
jgi:GNAT superfamily N-acetyltransferase